MEQHVILQKSDFDNFIERLAKIQKLIAPVKKGVKNFTFQ